MEIKRILYVEDSINKYMDIATFLKRIGIQCIEHARNAEQAMKIVDESEAAFDLFLFDMHFDFYGEDDHEAGEKLMNLMREKGYETPVVFCSSQNWKVPGTAGNIFYVPTRDWEAEAMELFCDLRQQ